MVSFNFIWQERMPVPFSNTGCKLGLGTNWRRSKEAFGRMIKLRLLHVKFSFQNVSEGLGSPE